MFKNSVVYESFFQNFFFALSIYYVLIVIYLTFKNNISDHWYIEKTTTYSAEKCTFKYL